MSWLRTVEPSLRSDWLGRRLRALREERGFTLRHVEQVTGLPFGEIKAAEYGSHVLQVGQVGALLALYGLADHGERDLLLELARDVRYLHRWGRHVKAPPLSAAALDYLWLESHARQIRCYSAALVPGLLQIPEYAEAVAGQSTTEPERVSWWGWACSERQRVLDCPPQALRAVVAEAVLRRSPGRSVAVLRRQLRHLAEAVNMPNVTVQVLPTATPYLRGMDGSFSVFDLAPPYPPAAVAETLVDPIIHEERRAGQYAAAFEALSKAALDEAASAELIAEAAEQLSERGE